MLYINLFLVFVGENVRVVKTNSATKWSILDGGWHMCSSSSRVPDLDLSKG